MTVAIMQPYFFPYLGYFGLILNSHKVILLDSVQFIRHGWIERNRILKPGDGWQYFSVPLVKHSRETKIKDIEINNETAWQEKILAQLVHYKKRAPYYNFVINLLKGSFSKKYNSIVELNRDTLIAVCHYLRIPVSVEVFSEMKLIVDKVDGPGDWALNICKAMGGVREYLNPASGMDLFDISKYAKNNINIKFFEQQITVYDQKRLVFEPSLSIIDVMMFNSPDVIKTMLDKYEIF